MSLLTLRSFCFLALLIWMDESDCNNVPTVDDHLFGKLLTALERSYRFYELEYKNINLDGIYGLRVSQGALIKILEEHKSGIVNLDEQTESRVSSLQRLAAFIAKKSLPILKKVYPSYFKKFKFAISEPWKNFKSSRKLDHTLSIPVDKRSEISFDEDTSDHCMTEMSGTGNKRTKPCELSAHCWSLMTSKGAGGYALTHQALFLLVGELRGCKKNILKRLKEGNTGISLQGVYDRICASMYPQMLEYEKKKSSSNYDRDLYMEQGMMCGSMGYDDFLSPQRLKTILGWQKKSGCFGDPDDKRAIPSYANFRRNDIGSLDLKRFYMKNINPLDKHGFNQENIDDVIREDNSLFRRSSSRKLMSMRTMRSLLVEKALEGGCMSHVTGVATGTLGVYLRWAVHLNFPGPDANYYAQTNSKYNPKNHDKKYASHHIHMRRMMQNEPVLVSGRHNVEHDRGISMTTSVCFLMVVVIMLVFCGTSINKKLLNKSCFFLKRKKTSHTI